MPIRRTRASADDPELSRQKILADPFLAAMYERTVEELLDALGTRQGTSSLVVEIGAAGGITKDLHPWIETSDVRMATGVDREVTGERLPYRDASVDGLLAKDALHHIPDPAAHLLEVQRVLKPGARAAYLEPNWNMLSRLVFTHLHPEPFDSRASSWARTSTDPMDSNQALAYLIFVRDKDLLRRTVPHLRVVGSTAMNGLSFLLSGGVHTRTAVPESFLSRLNAAESRHPRLLRITGLNRLIVLERAQDDAG